MIRQTSDGVTLAIRAQPGARKSAINGVYGEGPGAQLKIAVHAPPLEGRANEALILFLAEFFSLPRIRVQLIAGESSRSKIFLLHGLTQSSVEAVLKSHR
jgi:uncharacterized protein